MVIVLPSAAFMSAMYFGRLRERGCGGGGGVVGAGSGWRSASVDVPPEQADRVPRANSALTPTSRVRRCFFM